MGTRISQAPGHATGAGDIDAILGRLRDGARRFARLSLEERAALARSMQEGYLRIAAASVLAACVAKGIPPGSSLEGEEWALGPWMVVRHLRLVREALEGLRRAGNTPIGAVGRTQDGRLSVSVFPAGGFDRVLFGKITSEVHLLPGIDEARMREERAGFYKQPGHEGRVAMVLGAGNVNAIVAMDVISKMFNEGCACVVKMNPVNAYLGPFLEQAFGEAVSRGFLAVVYGGAEEGAYLARHSGVDEIHLTGSDRTYDAIVWGAPGPERERRRAEGRRLNGKPVSAELGNVSPVMVAPGPYTDKELAHQAEHVAGAFVNNASFNCCGARVLVLPQGWNQRQAFLDALEGVLRRAPSRSAWYPGARRRWAELVEARADARVVGPRGEGRLPWAILPGAGADGGKIFSEEWFCPVVVEMGVGSADPVEFLDAAVTFANETLWGTLSATLIVHPKLARDPLLQAAVEQAIIRLRYGTVAVNAFPGLSFSFATPPWGAYPGATPEDIQSGSGFVHNTPMLEGIEKTVLRHPLTLFPKPAIFPSHRTRLPMTRGITRLEGEGGWRQLPALALAALRG